MYWNRYRRTKNQEGSALVASLLVVMLVAGMGAGLIQVQSAMMRRQLLGIDRTRALYVAEAGLSESFLAISQGKTGRIGTVDDLAQYDDGVFWVEAEEQASGDIVLTSTGLCGQGRFSLSVVVTPPTSPIGTLGFFGIDSLTINEESIIDGFDPTLGTFQDQVVAGGATDGGARLRSNGDIDIRGSLAPTASYPSNRASPSRATRHPPIERSMCLRSSCRTSGTWACSNARHRRVSTSDLARSGWATSTFRRASPQLSWAQ